MKTRCKQVMITKNTTVCHMIIGARNSFDTAWGEAVSNLALFFRLAGGIAKQCAVRQQNPDGRALPRRHLAAHAAASLAPPSMLTARFMLYAKNDSENSPVTLRGSGLDLLLAMKCVKV